MDQNKDTIFIMDYFAIMSICLISEYLSNKYHSGKFSVDDPYFFLLFLYLDYLGNRFRRSGTEFFRLLY